MIKLTIQQKLVAALLTLIIAAQGTLIYLYITINMYLMMIVPIIVLITNWYAIIHMMKWAANNKDNEQ